jgi:hypothetical protein
LEQIDVTSTDRFIRQVYDWNPYGSAYAIAGMGQDGLTRVRSSTVLTLLAMIAERKWDPITATADRARDALSVFPTGIAGKLLRTEDLREVIELVRSAGFDDEDFRSWAQVFTSSPSQPISEADIVQLSDERSIIAWTFSNVLKRTGVHLSEHQLRAIRGLATHSNSTVRWRAVHVLGAFPSTHNARLLVEVFDRDSHQWVKYGAIRSLMELAARAESRDREWVFERLSQRATALLKDENQSILNELVRAAFISKRLTPKDWGRHIRQLFAQFHAESEEAEERDRWVRLAYRARGEYEDRS